MAQIDAFFKLMHEQGASDLHLVSGQQPILRIGGELERVKYQTLENDGLKFMLYEITPEHKIKLFEETGDVDFAYEIPGLARYRVNYYQQRWGVGAAFRETPQDHDLRGTRLAEGYPTPRHTAEGIGPGDRSNRQWQIHNPRSHRERSQRQPQRPYHHH
jgi:Tfp pilus assembly pilus retraction ATPase PilT